LAAAGEDVHFIAGGQHLAALRANGLVLKSANGDLHLQSVSATDDPASIGSATEPESLPPSVSKVLPRFSSPSRFARSRPSITNSAHRHRAA
jgi:Ketopantoate reductase PanE/ApbA